MDDVNLGNMRRSEVAKLPKAEKDARRKLVAQKNRERVVAAGGYPKGIFNPRKDQVGITAHYHGTSPKANGRDV